MRERGTADHCDRSYLTISAYLFYPRLRPEGCRFKNGPPSGHEKSNAISTIGRIYREKHKAFRPDVPRNSLIDPLSPVLNVDPLALTKRFPPSITKLFAKQGFSAVHEQVYVRDMRKIAG